MNYFDREWIYIILLTFYGQFTIYKIDRIDVNGYARIKHVLHNQYCFSLSVFSSSNIVTLRGIDKR